MNGGEIETLFVERIAQLLKPRGIAAVILPSSILSNDSASYTGAREQLLQNFYIRGIAAFGSKTFGATGTNTVVMFLEKFNEPPKQADLSADSVDAVFSGAELAGWKDKDIFEAYLAQIDVGENEYRAFLEKSLSIAGLEASEYFKMYVAAFADSADARNLLKAKAYQQKSADEQAAVYLERLYSYASSIEREKLFYFSLVYQQTTVIITAPADNKAQKEFLGYDWSNRKGNEGIQIITPGGKMYDDADRAAEGTLANAIKKSFQGDAPYFREEVREYGAMVSTKNMLDFSRIDFNKAIRTSVRKPVEIHSKYPIVKLSSVVEIISGGTPDTKVPEYWGGDIPWLSVADFNNGNRFVKTAEKHITQKGLENSNARFLNVGDIIISARGTVGAVAQIAAPMTFNQSCYGLRGNDQIDNGFLYYVLSFERPYIESLATGMKFPSIVKNTLDQIQIPLPPMDVQKKLVHACAKIDEEYNIARRSIETYRQKIADLFAKLDAAVSASGDRLSLSDTEKFSIAIGKRVLGKELVSNGKIPVYSANVTAPFGFIDKLLITDFSVPSVLWGIDGDWMTSYIPEETAFYPTDHCGVLRCKTSAVNPRYLAHILEVEGGKMGFSRAYRASIDRVQGITFTVPDISIQNNAMSKVKDHEMAIKELEGSLEKIAFRRNEIIRKALAE